MYTAGNPRCTAWSLDKPFDDQSLVVKTAVGNKTIDGQIHVTERPRPGGPLGTGSEARGTFFAAEGIDRVRTPAISP